MESVNIPQFKDFVVNKQRYHVNTRLRVIKPVSCLSTDKMHINGELKIKSFKRAENEPICEHVQGMYVELPTGDEIFIPASDHPWIEFDQHNYPVFIESEPELSWHEDLTAGEFYIMLNRFGEKKLILIKYIFNDKIEYASCNSRYDRNNSVYFVESVAHELMMAYAKDYKFISLKDITC